MGECTCGDGSDLIEATREIVLHRLAIKLEERYSDRVKEIQKLAGRGLFITLGEEPDFRAEAIVWLEQGIIEAGERMAMERIG